MEKRKPSLVFVLESGWFWVLQQHLSRCRCTNRILLGHNQLKPLVHMGWRAFLNFTMYGYILKGRLESVDFKGLDTQTARMVNYINFKHETSTVVLIDAWLHFEKSNLAEAQ